MRAAGSESRSQCWSGRYAGRGRPCRSCVVVVVQVMGEVLSRVLMEHEGEWPRGQAAFERDYQRVRR